MLMAKSRKPDDGVNTYVIGGGGEWLILLLVVLYRSAAAAQWLIQTNDKEKEIQENRNKIG